MGKICYAVSGEGRGHATRARTVIEELWPEHEIVLYAPDQAFDLLEPHYRDTSVSVRKIPGLQFDYTPEHRLDYPATAYGAIRYLLALPRLVRQLTTELEEERPDLVITDFDPALPRAAWRCGIPYLSLDHQHFLTTYDLSSLSFELKAHAAFMATCSRFYYSRQIHTVVSSFYFPPLRQGLERVTQIGVLLRPEIRDATPTEGDYLLAYLRRSVNPNVLRALADCGMGVRIYGLGERPAEGRLTFHGIDVLGFAKDLAGCRALISTAGNQLIGEAQYLGKAVLAMPETGNREQQINAHFLRASGAGEAAELETLDAERVRAFLDRTESLASRIDRERLCGNPKALAIIRQLLADVGGQTKTLPSAA